MVEKAKEDFAAHDTPHPAGTSGQISTVAGSVPVFADFETERAVLASILIEPASINTAMTVIGGLSTADDGGKSPKKPQQGSVDGLAKSLFRNVAHTIFYDQKHAAIYEAMLQMHEKSIGIDVLSLSDWLSRAGRLEIIGGQAMLLEIQSAIASTANMESWCMILRDYAMLREMVRTCSSALEMCRHSQDDVKTLLDTIESEVFKVRNKFVQPEIKELKTLVTETFEHFMKILNKEVEPGIPTEFPDLDKLIGGGLKPGEMFVLAARPSIGKTALALNIVRNIVMKDAGKKRSVAFFSLEMSAEQVTQRLLCTEAKVPLSSIIDGSFKPGDMSKLTSAVKSLSGAKLYIDPTGGISVFELRAKARKLKEAHNIDLIVIDYLQLMKAGDASAKDGRQVEVSAISGGLKKLAKDLNVPVLVLAQLNRELEKGQSAKALPKLSHLRESGAIEQDADVVVFLHRNRDDAKESNTDANRSGVESKLIVEKNRNGKTGIVELKFYPSMMEFRCVEHRYGSEDVPSGKVS